MIRLLFLWLALSCGLAFGQSPFPSAATVAEAMRRANNYWTNNNGVGNSGWARGAYYAGNQRAFRVLGERAFYNWELAWGGANLWKIGPEGSGSADAYCCGQTYLDLYRMNPQSNFLADIKAKTDALVASPAVNGWSWIDAFFMQSPVLARLGSLTGNTNYYQKLWLMYDDMKTARGLFDTNESLWYRDGGYIYPTATNDLGGKVFWSRGNGWVFASLARDLQQMPTNAPHYQDFVTMFQAMAAAIKPIQSPDGLWRSSLYETNQFPNPESSGTGFFTYGLAWGIRNGFLSAADYTNAVLLAWQGLTNLALNPSGLVGYVQNVGAAPSAATATATADFGVGAFLLACSEVYLLAPDAPALRPWAGPDQTLVVSNATDLAPLSLEASQTEFYGGTAAAYTWWDGPNQLASGPTAQTNLALGQHVISLRVLSSDGLTYTDAMTVSVITNTIISNPPPVLKMQFGFEDSDNNTTDSLAGVSLNIVNAAGFASDLHGALGSGVGGAGRSLDFSSASAQGGTGPLASTVGNSTINFGVVSNFTATLWIKPRSTLLGGFFPRLFSLGTNGTTDRATADSLQLLSNGNQYSGGNTTSVQGFVNTFQTSPTAYGAFDMPTNQWRFLAMTYDGTTLNFYGGSETNAVALLSSTSLAAGNVNLGNSWTLFLGNNITGANGPRSRAFRGQLDDVRFYLGVASVNYLESVRAAATAPPAIVSTMTQGNSNIVFRTNTRLGTSYILQSAPDLTAPVVWTSVVTNAGTGGPLTNSLPQNSPAPKQFFRYLLQ